jgi:hypothetical protein
MAIIRPLTWRRFQMLMRRPRYASCMPASWETLTFSHGICNSFISLYFTCEIKFEWVHERRLSGMPKKGYHCLNPVVESNSNRLDAFADRQFLALGHHRPNLPMNASITNRIPFPSNNQNSPMTYFGHVRQRGFSWDCNAPPIHFYIGNKLSVRQPP